MRCTIPLQVMNLLALPTNQWPQQNFTTGGSRLPMRTVQAAGTLAVKMTGLFGMNIRSH